MTIDRLRQCAVDFTALVSSTQDEAALLAEGRTILSRLIAHDDWLPDFAAAPDAAARRPTG